VPSSEFSYRFLLATRNSLLATNMLSTKHLLGIKYVTREDIELILDTAKEFKEVINRPIKKVPSLRDITVANLFFENSTRTRKRRNAAGYRQ